ncbi:cyclophilin-like fold protein [Ligilactobacillus equi]
MHQRGIIVTLLGLILLAFVALFIRQNRVQSTTKVKTDWQPDNRLVLYHGPVGSYPGIKVIGSFDNAKAVYALKKMADNTEVTFSK